MSIKKGLTYLGALVAVMLLLSSCNEVSRRQSHGPIILGDSSAIVTETNARNLQDMVADLHPNIPATSQSTPDTVKKPVADSTHAPAADTPAHVALINGLNIPFKEITISIPDINTKSYHAQNLAKAASATYQLISGSLHNKQIRISSGTAGKVLQHYQTIIVLKNDLGTLPLETLSNLTDWEELQGKNNIYAITGLSGKLEAADFNLNALHKAISKAARKHHLSRASEREWINAVRNTRANKKTINTVLRSVWWKVDGKDAGGKNFSKQVRIDVPGPEFSKE